jgi:hypothetical protein
MMRKCLVWVWLTGGFIVGRLILLFTILSNEKDSEVSKLAFEMVGNAQAVTDRPRKAPTP